MIESAVASHLRFHRVRSGLSRKELADVLGSISKSQVGRHERGAFTPTFITAISLEIVFRTKISELFPGVYETVRQNVEQRLYSLEAQLQENTARGRKAALIARKLEWLWERRNSEDNAQDDGD